MYWNGQYGSASAWTWVKGPENPENAQPFYSLKGCRLSMQQAIAAMIKRKLGRDTFLTPRQQTNLLKKLGSI